MASYKIFSEIQIGKKFKTQFNITYKKISNVKARPVLDKNGTTITNPVETTVFANSKMKFIEV